MAREKLEESISAFFSIICVHYTLTKKKQMDNKLTTVTKSINRKEKSCLVVLSSLPTIACLVLQKKAPIVLNMIGFYHGHNTGKAHMRSRFVSFSFIILSSYRFLSFTHHSPSLFINRLDFLRTFRLMSNNILHTSIASIAPFPFASSWPRGGGGDDGVIWHHIFHPSSPSTTPVKRKTAHSSTIFSTPDRPSFVVSFSIQRAAVWWYRESSSSSRGRFLLFGSGCGGGFSSVLCFKQCFNRKCPDKRVAAAWINTHSTTKRWTTQTIGKAEERGHHPLLVLWTTVLSVDKTIAFIPFTIIIRMTMVQDDRGWS